jgi:hypothetical protein
MMPARPVHLCVVRAATAALLCLTAAGAASAQPSREIRTMHATGTFDVKVIPQQPDNEPARTSGVGRLALEKRFQGALRGNSHGEMLAWGDGSTAGGYVAVEKIGGMLDGKAGSFALLHRALLRNAKPEQWQVLVVPGSGTGALAGIDGEMTIRIEGGVHRYELTYTLPAGGQPGER